MSRITPCEIGAAAAVRLTKLELRLLQMLLVNAGRTVGSDRLLVHIWGHRNSGDRQLLKQLVHRLRQKIETGSVAAADPADRHRRGLQAGRRVARFSSNALRAAQRIDVGILTLCGHARRAAAATHLFHQIEVMLGALQ